MDTNIIADVEVDASTFRTAQILIERHGAGALEVAERQVERLGTLGYPDAAAGWRGIARMIRELAGAPLAA